MNGPYDTVYGARRTPTGTESFTEQRCQDCGQRDDQPHYLNCRYGKPFPGASEYAMARDEVDYEAYCPTCFDLLTDTGDGYSHTDEAAALKCWTGRFGGAKE